jgi:hypothetical protein
LRLPTVRLTRGTPNPALPERGGRPIVFDIIFILLGFGGILAMAGYAVLCDRI